MSQTRQSYHGELDQLNQQLLRMGTLAGRMIADAVEALQQNDATTADSVRLQDQSVDILNLEIEARCMRLLALQQPVARDLRQVGTALKVITDLERIADHAVDIANIARKFAEEFYLVKPLVDIGPLAGMAQTMVRQSLEALIRHDTNLARQICADDDAADSEFKHLREQLFTLSQDEASLISPVAYMLLAVVYLERIADHATNIAERVNYVETGRMEPLSRQHRLEVLAQE